MLWKFFFNKRRILTPNPFCLSHSSRSRSRSFTLLLGALQLSFSLYHSPSRPLTVVNIVPYSLAHRADAYAPCYYCVAHCVAACSPRCPPCCLSRVPYSLSLSLVGKFSFSLCRSLHTFFYYSFDFDFINNLYVLHEHIYMFTKLFTLSLLGFWLS